MFSNSLRVIAGRSLRLYSQIAHKCLNRMDTVYFRHKEGETQLQINFRYTNLEYGIDRDFNFNRNLSENIEMCLDRIKSNIAKEFGKKIKKKKNTKTSENPQTVEQTSRQLPEITVSLLKDNKKLSNMTFTDILSAHNTLENMYLQVLQQNFKIAYNMPLVENIVLPTSILDGFFIYPSKLQLQFAKREHCKFTWYRGKMPKSKNQNEIEWEEISEGITYNTRRDDIGYKIKIKCIPGNGNDEGPPVEYISRCEVEAGPGRCPFEVRHMFTKEKTSGDCFRVVTYNILADLYADSDYTRKELFPYCPPYALNIDYRKQLFVKEILGYNGDIICLQEVDSKIFDLDLEHIFDVYNYDGTFQKKGTTAEGLATFYSRNRFELVEKYGINIGENIPIMPVFNELWEKIKKNEKLVERIVDRSTALQVTTLRSKSSEDVVIVANTHLYFHPDADHVRLLQFGFSMLYVEDVYKKTLENLNLDKSKLSIIFCGDFNSVPECGIYKLMTEKCVEEGFVDWSSNKDEEVKGVSLTQPFNIQSACGCPMYTNFTAGFAACLDYIFYHMDNLEVKEVIPLPSDEELKAHIAIPSVVFPSDHVSLVADLKWKQHKCT